MRLILIGPPGSGKGTQAKLLSARLNLQHIATGDILRDAKRQGTPEGLRAKAYMDAGQLVPDALVNDIVNARFRAPDRPTRFVMDGYPRNVAQAQSFDLVLRSLNLDVDAVALLDVADEEIIQRVSARRSCPNPSCQATYNLLTKPPARTGVCDDCQTPLVHRDDDKPDTVRQRLRVYHDVADPLLAYYRERDLVVEVSGLGAIEAIYHNIVQALADH